jgi:imidazolonepropionase-like amidohydrolase
MVEGGMTPMQALVAATSTPARLIGRQDELGALAPGMLADVIAVQGDPLSDIALFSDVERVRVVVKDGRVVRTTGS